MAKSWYNSDFKWSCLGPLKVFLILVMAAILDGVSTFQVKVKKGVTQGSFLPGLVHIELEVTEKKIKKWKN